MMDILQIVTLRAEEDERMGNLMKDAFKYVKNALKQDANEATRRKARKCLQKVLKEQQQRL